VILLALSAIKLFIVVAIMYTMFGTMANFVTGIIKDNTREIEPFYVDPPLKTLRNRIIPTRDDDGYTSVSAEEVYLTTIDDKMDNVIIKPKIRPITANTDYCCDYEADAGRGALLYDQTLYDGPDYYDGYDS
jgi:hypothetical protein